MQTHTNKNALYVSQIYSLKAITIERKAWQFAVIIPPQSDDMAYAAPTATLDYVILSPVVQIHFLPLYLFRSIHSFIHSFILLVCLPFDFFSLLHFPPFTLLPHSSLCSIFSILCFTSEELIIFSTALESTRLPKT